MTIWAFIDAGRQWKLQVIQIGPIWRENSKKVGTMITQPLLPAPGWEIGDKGTLGPAVMWDAIEHFNLFKLELFDVRVPEKLVP